MPEAADGLKWQMKAAKTEKMAAAEAVRPGKSYEQSAVWTGRCAD
jgi:hypothetical protein